MMPSRHLINQSTQEWCTVTNQSQSTRALLPLSVHTTKSKKKKKVRSKNVSDTIRYNLCYVFVFIAWKIDSCQCDLTSTAVPHQLSSSFVCKICGRLLFLLFPPLHLPLNQFVPLFHVSMLPQNVCTIIVEQTILNMTDNKNVKQTMITVMYRSVR